jgi:hypothetical protein
MMDGRRHPPEYFARQAEAFARFMRCLAGATSRVGAEYMLLPVAGFPVPVSIYRERVYCYELYHQLRLEMGNDFGFSLSGEVDKRSHRLIRGRGLTNTKPDLLVHTPGDMLGNLVVIEVKPVNASSPDIRKDLITLTAFRRAGGYHQAIYLIYGPDEAGFDRIRQIAIRLQYADEEDQIRLDSIILVWHRAVGEAAELVYWG